MTKKNVPDQSQFLLYQTEDGQTRIEVRLENETVWLNQAQMCELFDKDKRTISEHIRNIFKEGELHEDSVVRKFRTTAADGKLPYMGMPGWTEAKSGKTDTGIARLDDFLKLSGRNLLTHAGKVSNDEAMQKALKEYEKYRLNHLNDPAPVERHFLEATREMKQIEQQIGKSSKGKKKK
ncbi:MAG TPA: hypothetical protein ENG80_01235 [Nitrospirae bacterium]|nr:hypothetical protein [Nitrospirota bacterium]